MIPPLAFPPGSAGGGMEQLSRVKGLPGDLLGCVVLTLVSLLMGLGINRMRHQPLPLVYRAKEDRLRDAVVRLAAGESPTTASASKLSPREIGLEEFQLFVAHNGTVIDARSPLFYSQGHVPGAINLPRESFGTDYARLGNRLSARKADAVTVYCSGADCPDAQLVANALGALGFRHLFVYGEGWDEWAQSGLPQEK